MALTTRTRNIIQAGLVDRKGAKELGDAMDLSTSISNSLAPMVTNGQATTGTAGTAGQIAITGMTATGKVQVTGAEVITNGVGYIVAGTGLITVYDTTGAAISGKKINYVVQSLS